MVYEFFLPHDGRWQWCLPFDVAFTLTVNVKSLFGAKVWSGRVGDERVGFSG